jgi:hypothetical protein
MNHDVVVEPTQCCQVLRVGWTTFRPWDDVMHLQPVEAVAIVGGASAIAVEYEPS